MRKKLLLFTFSLFLSLPIIAKEFTYEYEGQKIIYSVIDEEAKTVETLKGVNSAGNYVSDDLVLPAHPKDGEVEYTLTRISDNAFLYCQELTSVIIPNTVTEIGESAFYCCYELSNINLPNSVTVIGEYAFSNCI